MIINLHLFICGNVKQRKITSPDLLITLSFVSNLNLYFDMDIF